MIATSQKWKDYSRDIGVFHIKATLDNDTTENLLHTTALHDDYMLLPDGTIVAGNGQYHTDFIAVEDGAEYNASLSTVFLYTSAFVLLDSYDISDRHFTAAVSGNTVAYVRFNGILSRQANDYVRQRYSLELTDGDFMMGSVSITDSISDLNEFRVGSVITNTFNATLNNFDGKFNGYLIAGATMAVQFGIVYEDETEEWIDRGVYTLEKPSSLGSTIKIVGYDRMDKLNKYFDNQTGCPNLFNPNKAIKNMYANPDGSVTSNNNWFMVESIPVQNNHSYKTNLSERTDPNNPPYVCCYDQNGYYVGYVTITDGVFSTYISGRTIGYIACNGLISNINNSYIIDINDDYYIPFPESARDVVRYLCNRCGVPFIVPSDWTYGSPTIVAFDFDESTTCRQVLGWILEICGMYARINPSGYLECKKFKDTNNADLTLSNIRSLDVYIEDIVITGVTAFAYNTVDQFETYTYGDTDYAIPIRDNPLVDLRYQTARVVAERVGALLVGLTLRPFDASIIGDPSIEAGDVVELEDYLGNTHTSIITSLTYSVNQNERLECNIDTQLENELANPQTQTVSQTISAIQEKTDTDGINVNGNASIDPSGYASFLSVTIDGESVEDFVIEEGTWGSNGWYRKWHSGKAECFGTASITTAISSTYGNGYYATSSATFPTGLFAVAPVVNITMERSQGLLFASIYSRTASNVSFYVGSMASETSASVTFHVSAIGRWK